MKSTGVECNRDWKKKRLFYLYKKTKNCPINLRTEVMEEVIVKNVLLDKPLHEHTAHVHLHTAQILLCRPTVKEQKNGGGYYRITGMP